MGAIETLQAKLNNLLNNGLTEIIAKTAKNYEKELLYVQKQQLLAGQNAEGKSLFPTYSADPYFKSPAKAAKYAKFKANLKLEKVDTRIYPEKNDDTPNLIVTGVLFHNLIYVETTDNSIIFDSTGVITSRLISKYGQILGLNAKGWKYMRDTYMLKDIKRDVINYLKS